VGKGGGGVVDVFAAIILTAYIIYIKLNDHIGVGNAQIRRIINLSLRAHPPLDQNEGEVPL
jgi:hypothetical protein